MNVIVTDFDEFKEGVYSDEFIEYVRELVIAEGLQNYNEYIDAIVNLCLTGK